MINPKLKNLTQKCNPAYLVVWGDQKVEKIVVSGGRPLSGELCVQGSKNAVLPIIAACVMCDGECVIKNCPDITDVRFACEIICALGGTVKREGGTLTVDTRGISTSEIPKELMHKMRSSVMFLGAMLTRLGSASVYMPGGCEIGARPVDIHIKALSNLGAVITEEGEKISCKMDKAVPCDIYLPFPSVGATENAMMAAVLSDGITRISNPAMEPEITELQKFINAMGGKVSGAGTKMLVVEGVKKLKGTEFTVACDRIVCATYLFGAAATKGKINLKGVPFSDMEAVVSVLSEMGCNTVIKNNEIKLDATGSISGVRRVRTQVFPGFPTDAQAPLCACLCVAKGTSVVQEEIFENRFRHAEELMKMGADIRIDNRIAVICGVKSLIGAEVYARDLRGAGALCVAGLAASGETTVIGTEYLDRGYEKAEVALSLLGADIKREG